MDRNVAHAAQQIFQSLRMQRKVDAVYILTAQRRIHDDRRKRMRHRISGHAIDPGGRIHLFDAVGAA